MCVTYVSVYAVCLVVRQPQLADTNHKHLRRTCAACVYCVCVLCVCIVCVCVLCVFYVCVMCVCMLSVCVSVLAWNNSNWLKSQAPVPHVCCVCVCCCVCVLCVCVCCVSWRRIARIT